MDFIYVGDDEQTVPPSFANTVCNSFAQLGNWNMIIGPMPATDLLIRCKGCHIDLQFRWWRSWRQQPSGLSSFLNLLLFPIVMQDPATTTCIANDGSNRITFLPAFPASCPLSVFELATNSWSTHNWDLTAWLLSVEQLTWVVLPLSLRNPS